MKNMVTNHRSLLNSCGCNCDFFWAVLIESSDLQVWDLRMEKVSLELRGHGDSVTGMALHADGNSLLTNSMDNTLRIWDVRPYAPANRCTHVMSGHQHTFEKHLLKCAWSGDRNRVAAGSGDRFVYIWDVYQQRVVYKLPGHSGSVNEAVFHPTQPIIASASSDGTIFLGEIAEYGD
jgi:Prp8 binding protein